MKRELLAALVVIVFLGIGCKTTVNQLVENGGTIPLDMVINVKDEKGIRKATHPIGEIAPGGKTAKTFEVNNGDAFLLYASLGDAVVYKSPEFLVSGKVDPLEPPVIVAKPTCRILDDTLTFNTLSKSFKDLGPDIGARPMGLKDALTTTMGSLVVAIPGDANSARKGEILYSITPGELDVKVMTLDDVDFPGTFEKEKVAISGSASANANASYNCIAKFSINFAKESTYELSWELKGFGQIKRTEDPAKKPDDQIDKLSENTKAQIRAMLNKHPSAGIYYINQAYVVQNASMSYKEGKTVTGESALDAANVVTLKGVVSFKESQEKNSSYGPVVLSYWGNEHELIESRPLGFGEQEKEYRLTPTGKSAWFKAAEPR